MTVDLEDAVPLPPAPDADGPPPGHPAALDTDAPTAAPDKPDEWPALVSFDDVPALPVLDLAYLSSWAGRFAHALAASTETPPELPASMVLANVTMAAARRIEVEAAPGHREVVCNWFVCALPPANRKSTVEAQAKAPAMAWEADKAAELEPDIRTARSERKTADARLKALRAAAANPKAKPEEVRSWTDEVADIERDMPEVPVPPRVWTSEPTPEKLGVMLAEHGEAMSVQSSEGDVFEVLAGRYSRGAPNIGLVLKAHDGDADLVDRLGRDTVRLTRPRLTLGLCVQPPVLAGLADTPQFGGRGLIARVLFFVPRSPLGTRRHDGPPIPHDVASAYMRGVRAMLDWPEPAGGGCHVVTLSDAAREEWRAFRAAVEPRLAGDVDELTCAWLGKAPGHALRLAAVLHGVEHAHGSPWPWEVPVPLATMAAALDLMATTAAHSLAALAMMSTTPAQARARRTLEWLSTKAPAGCTVRDVHVGLKARFESAAQVRATLAALEERGYLRVVEPDTRDGPGRPRSPAIVLRPEPVPGHMS